MRSPLEMSPHAAHLIEGLTSKQLKVATEIWLAPSENICSPRGAGRTDPAAQLGPQPSARALPLSSHADPSIYNQPSGRGRDRGRGRGEAVL